MPKLVSQVCLGLPPDVQRAETNYAQNLRALPELTWQNPPFQLSPALDCCDSPNLSPRRMAEKFYLGLEELLAGAPRNTILHCRGSARLQAWTDPSSSLAQ